MPEYIGILGIFWEEKVLDAMNVPFTEELMNFFNTAEIVDRPYRAYQQALKNGYAPWNSNSPDMSLINYMMTIDTQDNQDRILSFLNAIYTLTLTGDIDSSIINGGETTSQTQQVIQDTGNIAKSAVQAASTAVQPALSTLLPSLTPILIIGAVGIVGYLIFTHNKSKAA